MQTQQHTYDVLVIGGGASGMMAAATAAKEGKTVLLLEKNAALGEKLKISGGGRCNITNAETDLKKILSKYGDAEKFLYSPFTQFGVTDTFSFFEDRGLPLVVEARKRAFPETQKATDVCQTLKDALDPTYVTVKTNAPVSAINMHDGAITGVRANKTTYHARTYILATGGVSHPETGSTGDGFEWLKDLGHTVSEPTPTLVPLATSDAWGHALSGISLSFMKISFFVGKRKAFSRTGKLLFTHFGISGPLVLNAAKEVADLQEEGEVTATIDCFPDTDHGSLNDNILRIFNANKNKQFKNVFPEIAPKGIAESIRTHLLDIDPHKSIHSITSEERRQIMHTLKALPIHITGRMGYDRAVIVDGGIPLTEVETRTMQSKVVSNLYVTGDLLDINRPSGGYSLQLCWTTGYVAGMHA